MKYIKNIILFSLLLVVSLSNSQSKKLKKADKKFNDFAYVDALKIYEDVADSGYEDADLFKKLGDGYYFNADYIDATKWYSKLVAINSNLEPVYQFRYGQSLKASGNYEQADTYLSTFFESQGIPYSNFDNYLKNIEENSNAYKVSTVDFNTKYSDYPAFLKEDSLYVISGSLTEKKTPWNNEPTSDIFLLKNKRTLNNLGDTFNTKFNEGSLVITKNGTTMFFTRNDYNDRKRGRDANKTTRIKLYSALKENGTWDAIKELPFNNSEYSFGQPALSPDDSKLYFVSDMPGKGSKGGTDIYEVDLFEDGSFGTPSNMTAFNTPGNEMFPFVAKDGTFYFSSNGQVANLGGLDIYRSGAVGGVYNKVENIGKPVNGPMDDFAIVVDSDTNKGYFASNRIGAVSDDIYSFIYIEPCLVNYTGVVRDKKTGAVLDNVLVSLMDGDNKILSQKVVTAGVYEFNGIECEKAKFVRAEMDSYQTAEELLIAPIDGLSTTNVLLSLRKIELIKDTDLAMLLNPIYFDLDKSNIRPDAEVELQKIVIVMRDNPALKIDVRSHTDSRARDAYNIALSNRRAKSTLEYIVNAGIDSSRLTSKGYGETQLINECANGIKCSDQAHQSNRRSEFIIINN
ncbi:OmpA family protein [Lacinutrix jangbogonensis]|uniref:OmpA family protein n=1 Tax=Lacinutrix jangbogonensis TaxID=1469557 RepID=UPI00053CF776|nr:OmpA family protein [Lacinutrix jangbogonensis]